MIIFQTVFKLWSGQEIASEMIKGNNSESLKAGVVILVWTHRHDLFYITLKYHDYIPKGIQVTERTRICIKKHQRGD